MSISALSVGCIRELMCVSARVCHRVHLHALCMYESACLLPVWDLKSLSQRGLNHFPSCRLSRAMSGLSYQSIDAAPALPVALGGRCSRRPRAPPRRNTNGDADSFWFGHLSRHWSPCGLLRWWQMDCHLWMRGDWDTSPHISLSGVQSLPSFWSPLCACHFICPSLFLLMSLLCSIVRPPYCRLIGGKKVYHLTERLQVKSLQMPTVIYRQQTSKPTVLKMLLEIKHIKSQWEYFSTKNNSTCFLHLIKKRKEAGFVYADDTLSPLSVTWEANKVI